MTKLPGICFAWFVFLLAATSAHALTLSGVATSISIAGENVEDGSVICESDQGFILCSQEYSPQTYGVVVLDPDVGFLSTGSATLKPAITQGIARVRVSSMNGPINKGEYVAASATHGVGQKATRSGYALGIAQADWHESDPNKIGLIPVSVQPKPAIMTARAGANLIQLIKEGIDATYLSPVLALRYTLATLLTVSSVILGFWFFARVAHTGVQAIGRNPLAGRTIQIGILLNVLITLGVMAVGLGLAYLLLVI
ncbi:MAG TPA: hypothetical protein VD999_03480 [Vitreimonas sp.]|nr:hypothetical protein [Vitreimonas sp.]